MNQKLKTKKRN